VSERQGVRKEQSLVMEEVGNIIQVMPLSLANKIAAGEVVQRPASAVKELVENALDAGADDIQLLLKDAGSSLIQVIDNGCGMSPSDALLSFERHATSKIRTVEDLEAIHTLGFRGEALASIASVSQVELRSGTSGEAPAFMIRMDGGELVEDGPAAPMQGTSIAIRNLFFNVPARRNFLKRPQTELKHILDMIQVLALSHPSVGFRVEHEGNMLLEVEKVSVEESDTGLKRRAADLIPIGKGSTLISVEESTSYLAVRGILGAPESARRTRGQQFLFVNGRYVKHRYIEHAVLSAFEYLLPEGSYPFFVLFLDIDPRHVDVNVHPTKAEVKFDDERGVYGMLRAVVRRALGTSLGTPDISQAQPLHHLDLGLADRFQSATLSSQNPSGGLQSGHRPSYSADSATSWLTGAASKSLYEGAVTLPAGQSRPVDSAKDGVGEEGLLWQLHDTYILTQIRSGLVIIEQQAAHERILYEQALSCLKEGFGLSQQLLFPREIEFSAADYALLESLLPDLNRLGFDVEPKKKNKVSVRGVPADISTGDERSVLDEIIDQYRLFERVDGLSGQENLARSVARRGAVRSGNTLSPREMRALIDQLFQCESPYVGPDGRPTIITMSGEELRERFDQRP